MTGTRKRTPRKPKCPAEDAIEKELKSHLPENKYKMVLLACWRILKKFIK